MNAKSLLITALATAFVGAASATSKSPAELQQENQLRAPSTITRAAVLADLAQARAKGTLNTHPDFGSYAAAPARSVLTRAEVLAALSQARADGTLGVHPDHGIQSAAIGSRSMQDRAGLTMAAGGKPVPAPAQAMRN
jgi:hypothetical protein